MRDHGSIGLFLGNSDFGGEFGSECFGLFPFLFFCLVWGWKKSPTHKIFVGSQRERTTSSRGFFSFFCLWQFCTDQILSGPKTFLYIPFILFRPLIGNLSFSFAFFPRLIGNSFFLLFSFDLLTRNFLFSFSFNVWQGIFLILFSKACWQLNNEWVLFLGEIPLLLLSRARMEILILGWGLWWFEVWAQKAL